jgi:hypothetical protein
MPKRKHNREKKEEPATFPEELTVFLERSK